MNYRPEPTGRKLTSTAVCERYGITRRTLGRWMVDPEMGFPAPITFNNRHYFDEAQIGEFERRSVSNIVGKAA